MIRYYYGHWDYWELRHKVTFDGIRKLILINDGVTDIDVQRDIYSSWKEWVKLENNSKYERAIQLVGGEPTVEGQFLDATYFLINGWKVKSYPGQYTLSITGNIYDIGGGDIKVPADVISNNPNNISINLNTSNIVRRVTSGSGLSQDDSTKLSQIEQVLNIVQGLDVKDDQLEKILRFIKNLSL